MRATAQAAMAEGVGTFALVFVGAGAIMLGAITGSPAYFGIALAFGFVVGAVVFAFGRLSGAHINPAVTLALTIAGRFPVRRVPAYVLAQSAGAILAALLLRLVLGPIADIGATATSLSPGAAVGIEAGLTLFLVATILAVVHTRPGRTVSGLAIGGAVFIGALVGGGPTGASMNPARSLGPAVANGDLSQLWIYLVGPALGGVLAVAAFAATRAAIGALRSGLRTRVRPHTNATRIEGRSRAA